MTEFNSYPIFVADQVLMAEHLNEIVNYLDEQDRLTRNKLIGIGIVCGLELTVSPSKIDISKGCGVTSAGYLIAQDELSLTYYHPYALPSDFIPKYKAVYESRQMWELLTAEQSLAVENPVSIAGHSAFMRDKIVVLLLEMKEKPLKNCVETDCDDKGDKIEFAVKPLLVRRRNIDAFLKDQQEDPQTNDSTPSVTPTLQDVQLKRFNVPVNQLTSTDVVLNAFLQLVGEDTLKRLAQVLNYCYIHYKPILSEEAANPFTNVFELFKDRLALIKNSNPFFIQYYYDWIDDILKAYYEFKSKIFDVQAICCPDHDLFPLHLMLGEATKSTSIEFKSNYRHYFLYSPLFNNQKSLLTEVQNLFRRMRLLVENYSVPNTNTLGNTAVKITPSKYLDKPLSDRCIPYYYKPEGLYQCWSWSKTRKGNAPYNLSYNANQYNNSDAIVNPLLYDIERFNFFRIEGHIGKNYNQALTTLLTQRNQFNLPFEVVALSTATVARYLATDDKNCLFKDLESLYEVIVAELICRFGDLACLLADKPYQFQFRGPIGAVTDRLTEEKLNTNFNLRDVTSGNLTGFSINQNFSTLFGFPELKIPTYKRGDFMKSHCTAKKGTIGEVFINLVSRGHNFVKPSPTSSLNLNTVYAHLFYFIDCVENVMGASWPYSLKDYNPATFTARFRALSEEVHFIAANSGNILEVADELELGEELRRFPGLINTCFDERLEALKKEYQKRHQEIQALTNFMNYFKKHPGMEHKAGVPKGGTFLMVYHETPPRRPSRPLRDVFTHVPGAVLENVNLNKNILSTANVNDLFKEASVKDPALLKKFELALGSFLNACKDMDEDTKIDISDLLITLPAIRIPDKFRIPDYAVIADFYLPYICCSDCPPIAYMLPKEPEVVLSIRITPTEFCNNDESSYPVTVSPEGGSLSASAGGVEQGSFVFKPKGLNPGINKLTYTLPDGRSTSVDVSITEAKQFSFEFEILKDGITVKFHLADSDNIEKVIWEFGDGSKSEDLAPTHTYQFEEEEREFVVKLSVKEGPCFSTMEQTVRLRKPEKAAFDIVPKLFCSNDRRTYDFSTNPAPKNLKEIKNPDKLVMEHSAENGVVSFIPAKQNSETSREYKLMYKETELAIRLVVPNADFIMKLTNEVDANGNSAGIMLHLEVKEQEAEDYQWTLRAGDRQLDFSGKAIDISYRQIEIDPQNELHIILLVRHHIPGADCEDQKRFVIHPGIIDRFLNKEEFDNNTNI